MNLIDSIERFEAALAHLDTMVGMPDLTPGITRLRDAHEDLHDALLSCPEGDLSHGESFLPARDVSEGVFHNGRVYAAGYGSQGEPTVIRLRRIMGVFDFDDRAFNPCPEASGAETPEDQSGNAQRCSRVGGGRSGASGRPPAAPGRVLQGSASLPSLRDRLRRPSAP